MSDSELRTLTTLVAETAGVTKIRLTGGEPTLCPELLEHVRHAASLVDEIGLTTNGLLLEPLLRDLISAGLTRLNVSLDAVDPAAFRRFSRRDGVERVVSSLRAARAVGFDPLQVNAVALPDTDFAALVEAAMFEGWQLRFIELMAIGIGDSLRQGAYVDAETIRERLWDAGISLVEASGLDQPTARVYRIPGIDPVHASVGFITTGSDPFCATCNRLRLSSQGHLHTCLFDETGWDLITPLRQSGQAAVLPVIRQAVASKRPPQHFVRAQAMASIGG